MSRLDGVNPVGYSFNNFIGDWHISTSKPEPEWDYKKVEPLYTRDQLMPRVRFTQAEFDEFKNLFTVTDYASQAIATIISVSNAFKHLEKRIFSGSVDNRVKNENEFNRLWANYEPEHPEDTIEISKPKKWFVVSKERDEDGDYVFVSDINKINDFG